MLDKKTRLLQRKVRAECDEIFGIQSDIGALIEKTVRPDDAGARFRCRLLLNRCADADAKLEALMAELPASRETAVTRALVSQNRQIIVMQTNTLRSLLACLDKNSAISLEAKRAELIAEAALVRERIKKNGKAGPS